jgi:hypothetical protein
MSSEEARRPAGSLDLDIGDDITSPQAERLSRLIDYVLVIDLALDHGHLDRARRDLAAVRSLIDEMLPPGVGEPAP